MPPPSPPWKKIWPGWACGLMKLKVKSLWPKMNSLMIFGLMR